MRTILSSSLVVGALVFQANVFQGQAQIITLINNNSTAQLNPTTSGGMFNWIVQGQDQLNQQWFWYRVGPTNAEAPINTIGAPVVTQPTAQDVTTVYNNGQFSIGIHYTLTGGLVVPIGQIAESDVAETITINNLSGSPLDFHFFQYSDFDLGGIGNDSVQLGKIGSLFYQTVQTDPLAGMVETVNSPGANHGEAGLFSATLVKLNNGVADSLNDNVGPVGPGDATWALQWDLIINPGTSKIISKDKHLQITVVPEPSSWALMAAGLVMVGALVMRRRPA